VGRCDIGAVEFFYEKVTVRRARYDATTNVLFVTATSSAARDDVSLFLSVPACLDETPLLRVGMGFFFLDQVMCGNLDGQMATVISTGGGQATVRIR
jgi:hypothetical protein